MKTYEEIDSAKLISDNLRHIILELEAHTPSGFRVAREGHQVLLRSMVEALRGTANLEITGKASKDKRHYYRIGEEPWKMITKDNVTGCTEVWRYSEPVEVQPHAVPRRGGEGDDERLRSDFLLGFYDLLAMIQTPCFMLCYYGSTVVAVSDTDMKSLEWLHKKVRNEFEHFIPKTYYVNTEDCFDAALLCLRLSQTLLFECGNPLLIGEESVQIELHIRASIAKIREIRDDQEWAR